MAHSSTSDQNHLLLRFAEALHSSQLSQEEILSQVQKLAALAEEWQVFNEEMEMILKELKGMA